MLFSCPTSLSFHNALKGASTEPVFARHGRKIRSRHPSIPACGGDSLLSEAPSRPMAAPLLGLAVFVAVFCVGSERVPTKILKPVVGGVPVIVAGNHFRGAWADERLQYATVDFQDSRAAISIEPDNLIAVMSGRCAQAAQSVAKNSPLVAADALPAAPHIAIICDSVAFVADNIPVFTHRCPLAKRGVS